MIHSKDRLSKTLGRIYRIRSAFLKAGYIKLLKILIALSLLIVQAAFAQSFNTCCFCVNDPHDADVTKECQKWFTLQDQISCEYSATILSKDSVLMDSGKTCEKVKIWGGFHGLSYYYNYPLNISSQAANVYSAKEVEYDGSTCLIFNNTESVKTRAQALALKDTQTHFLISGNQNTGVVSSRIPFVTKPTENLGMASKMTLEISQGEVKVSYGACSAFGTTCGYATSDIGASTDSNKKFCMDHGELSEQSCCVKNARQEWGKWSRPGSGCSR